jgi:3-phenylpropionate/cinnamic acid dioxygenase small subunit
VRRRSPVALELHYDVAGWLDWEAELLDAHRYRDWLSLLAEDVTYRMPVTTTVGRGDSRSQPVMDHWDEDLYSLTKRVERLESEHAWTEDPPSRTRRFVTNVRVAGGSEAGEVEVRSYVLLFRSRGDQRPADLVSVERHDVLRGGDGDGDGHSGRSPSSDGDWQLLRRLITIDESVLRTQNLALFL